MENLTYYIEYLKHLKSLNRATLNIDEVINSLSKVKSITSEIKQVERPIIEHEYTQGEWSNTGLEIRLKNSIPMILATVHKHLPSNQSKLEAEANARLISQAPKMHQLCEAMFDMLKNTNNLYLPVLSEVLNEITPKK